MIRFESPNAIQAFCQAARLDHKSIGFVPTMGALHAGHLSLVDQCRRENDITIVSIFVNPAQFGKNEDLESYPNTLEADIVALAPYSVDVLFLPSRATMYPDGTEQATQVTVPELSSLYCGKSRPQFFGGITTIVSRLFNCILPTRAYFGEKDYQQLFIIQKMVRDLFLPITVVECPLIREPDGLAMSSRNSYLTPHERAQAPELYKTLQKIQLAVNTTALTTLELKKMVEESLHPYPFSLDYCVAIDDKLAEQDTIKPGHRLLVAAILGRTRLIDTLRL